jgi:hypothetical protein
MGKPEAKRSDSTDCCTAYAHVLIRVTIIKEPAVAVAHEPLAEHHLGNLVVLLAVVEQLKDCLLRRH